MLPRHMAHQFPVAGDKIKRAMVAHYTLRYWPLGYVDIPKASKTVIVTTLNSTQHAYQDKLRTIFALEVESVPTLRRPPARRQASEQEIA